MQNMNNIKDRMNVPHHLRSCHTASIAGYTIEGHVPAVDIKKVLLEKPAIAGLAVPAMPVGSPGMEMGNRKDPFDVIAFDDKGKTKFICRI